MQFCDTTTFKKITFGVYILLYNFRFLHLSLFIDRIKFSPSSRNFDYQDLAVYCVKKFRLRSFSGPYFPTF